MLKQKKYNSEINLYYQNDLYYELAEEIIRFVWLNQASSEDVEKFDLIRDIRSKVYKLKFENEIYYLKSYTPQNMSKIVKNYFRPADAVRYFQTSIRINQAGMAVAQPILALTRKRGFHPADSIFVTREVPGVDLSTYLMGDAQYDPELRKKIITQLALIYSKLVSHNLAHQDPCLRNFIIHPGQKEKDFQLQLIDVDNIYFMPLLPRKLLLRKNLKKLKWELGVTNFSVPQSEIDLFLDEIRMNLKNNIQGAVKATLHK